MENQFQWQYIIVTVLVICFIVWQIYSYRKNDMRIKRIRHLFPNTDDEYQVVQCNNTTTIYCENAQGDFKRTLDDVNKYLSKNENKTFDYQIIKEIVERNSQSLENEVDTMLSAPLYLGLMATIIGIAFGVVSFAWNDLASLLTGENMDPHGIKVLLTDVGIAMVASFVGVLCTKVSTQNFNDARTDMNQSKNVFLTWVQSDLMSKLSDDITGAILKMTADLNEFNRTFAENTKELKETLSTVNDNYEGQVKLLDTIEKLKITKIAKANIEVYDRLQGCTDELEKLFEIFSCSESYIAKVTELNNNIGSIEERTRLFEELGTYFQNEIEYVRDRQGYMRQQMSGLDSVLQDALSNLGDNLTHSLQQLTTVFQSQNQRIQELIETQQNELTSSLIQQQREVNERIGQIDNPFAGLKETFDAGIQSITSAFASQNTAIEEMLSNQKRLVEESLKTQQEAILQKFKDSPSQLQALSDIAKTLEKLNSKLGNPNTTDALNGATKKSKLAWLEKYNKILLPIGMVGTFLSLLALIAIMLCK
jgi:hypothetical protein